jgi:hypothetical protein
MAVPLAGVDLPATPPANPAPGAGAAPVLALTPAQVTTLTSGNVTSMNQLLGQLVSGNTSNQALTTLVNTMLAPPPTAAPSPAPTPQAPPPVVATPPTVIAQPPPTSPPPPTTAPPPVFQPINNVSRS